MGTVDFWPLLDTSLKILLGGLLTMAAIWLYQRRQQSSNGEQPQRRRIELLEQISTSVGTVNHCFARYASLAIESTKFGAKWPSARKFELEQVNAELVKEFRKLSDAEAKLLMLGETTMEKTLRLYGAKIALFRKQVYIGRQDITDQEIADLRAAVLQLRSHFYELLSRRYDRLLVA